MTVRSVYDAAVLAANVTRIATMQTAANVLQEAINAVGDNAGANPMLGVTAANDLTIKNARKIYQATQQKAGHDHQVAVNNARSVLQAAGDLASA